ncbi:MAG: potassium channel family protein [Planctomycetota bacterium]
MNRRATATAKARMQRTGEPSTRLSPAAAHTGFALIVLHILTSPYALDDAGSLFSVSTQALFYGLLIFVLIDVATHRSQVIACITLVAISTAIRLLSDPGHGVLRATAGWALVLCGLMILYLAMRRILVTRRVDPALISGTVSVYLLAGVTWAVAFHAIEQAVPGSYALPGQAAAAPSDLFYFSFVTLTTLGYGDIRPVSGLARTSAVLEAVFGQIFLVVLLGRLVSLQISTQKQNPAPTPSAEKSALSEGQDEI